MSGHDQHYRSRNSLPPIRDVLGDQFTQHPQRTGSPYVFDDVRGALPPVPSRSRGVYPSSGPVLPPIHSHGGYPLTGSHSSHSHSYSSSSNRGHHTSATSPSSTTGQPYSFDVFRPTENGLIHASSSSRSQGILRTTRADAGRRYAHADEDDDGDVNDSSRKYPCGVCGRRFGRPSSLKAHEISHTDDKPHVCPHPGCGRAFGIQSNMRRHYRNAHEGEQGSGSGGDYGEYIHPSTQR